MQALLKIYRKISVFTVTMMRLLQRIWRQRIKIQKYSINSNNKSVRYASYILYIDMKLNSSYSSLCIKDYLKCATLI